MIKKLDLQGSAKEIGVKHGTEGKEEVIHSLETYEKIFYDYRNITWEEAKEYSLSHIKAIEKYDLNMIEEMEGIAAGAGVDFEDILALNVRSEIALAGNKRTRFSDGCTAIGITSPIITDTIIGQNWDWKAAQKKSLLLLNIQNNINPNITMVTEGGIIGKIGFNSAGVGICFNALITDQKSNQVPIHLGLRAVLNSYSMTEAISKIKNGQIASSASFLIGYDDGNGNGMAVNAEISPFGLEYVGGNEGQLVHTNHICSKTVKKHIKDMNEFRDDDSILRKKRLEQLIDISLKNQDVINEQTFEKWLSDSFNAPNSINCFINDLAPEKNRMETVFSIIINLSKRKAYLSIGNSCGREYQGIWN